VAYCILGLGLWYKRCGGFCIRVFSWVLVEDDALGRAHNPFHFCAVFEKLIDSCLTGIKTL